MSTFFNPLLVLLAAVEIFLLLSLATALAARHNVYAANMVAAFLYAPVLLLLRHFAAPGVHVVASALVLPAILFFLYSTSYRHALKWLVVAYVIYICLELSVLLLLPGNLEADFFALFTPAQRALLAAPQIVAMALLLVLLHCIKQSSTAGGRFKRFYYRYKHGKSPYHANNTKG